MPGQFAETALPVPISGAAAPSSGPPRCSGAPGFLRRHLDGDYSLARSYWLHYVIGGNLYSVLADRLASIAADNLTARHASVLVIVLILGTYGWWLLLAIGTWASAGKHTGRDGSTNWAYGARIALFFGLVITLLTIPPALRTVRDHAGMLAGHQPGPAPAFLLAPDARSLVLHGGINDGTAAELDRLLARAPGVTTIVLASGGGWTREGRLIGEVIAARGLNTHVDSECSSACTLAFLAGKVRSARAGARLGFHLFGPGERTAGQAAVRKAYGRLGMESGFIEKINATSPERMWYPDATELLRYRVLTQAPGDGAPDRS